MTLWHNTKLAQRLLQCLHCCIISPKNNQVSLSLFMTVQTVTQCQCFHLVFILAVPKTMESMGYVKMLQKPCIFSVG